MRGPLLPGVARSLSRALARPPRGAWAAAAVGWGGVIFALAARPGDPSVEMSFLDRLLRNGAHAPVYAIFSSLLLLALAPRQGSGPTARAFGQALAVAVLYALSDEWHQHFVPGRAASLIDVATDGFGAACGLSVLRWTLGGGEPGGLALASLALAGGVASALLATTGFLGI